MNKKIQSTFILLLTAMIWGFAFVAQRAGMDFIGPFLFSALRMFIGCVTLIPIILLTHGLEKNKSIPDHSTCEGNEKLENGTSFARFWLANKDLFQGGLCAGVIIFFAANFQQVGLVFTTAAKTGFITTLYIVLVPIFGILLKHKVGINAWIGVIIATIGLYFLCLTQALTISFGDFIVLIGAGFWAAHILCIDHFVTKVSALKLVCLQFFVSGILSFLVALFTEEISWTAIVQTGPALVYVGVFSSAIAFTLQAIGQKHASPTAASIIMSTESVFGAIGGVLILHEVLSVREWTGCILMFMAIIVTQLPNKKKER
ncbi:MAG: DMT family transporter [Anaerovorax sp.]